MAQKTEMQAKDHQTHTDHIGDDEVTELQPHPNSFYAKVREQAERFACTRLGQTVIERIDRGLKLIEDTTKWSLPHDKNSGIVLERPLPWFPFLLLIIVLRLVRIWVSMGAFLIGNGPISPLDVIYFIQTRRRKLRAIRVHGLRMMRQNQLTASGIPNGTTFTQMVQWFNRAVCRPGANNCGAVSNTQQQNNELNKSVSSRRSRDEDADVDHSLTIDEMLSKYANENSEDDSDFVAPPESAESSNSSTSDLSDTDSHSSEQISSAEEQIMVETHDKIFPVMKVNQGKSITVNGSNGISEQTELVPAAQSKKALEVKEVEEQWKSSPGHLSAALTNTRIHNNTAAAGSPNNFNSCIGTPALLKNAAIIAAPSHSTPNSEQDEIYSAGSEMEDHPRQSISVAYPAEPKDSHPSDKPYKQQQQQQQRQFNHSHQRFRGRNRR